ENLDYDYLAVNFVNTSSVRNFKDYLKEEFDLDIDMAQIEAKENFSFVTRLTRIISLVLIGLSVLSICLFVSSIFRRHLDKIRRNIGTFKAFGLDNGTLMQTYLVLINVFIGISMAGGLLLAWIFGALGGIRLILRLTQNKIEAGESYFQLGNVWTLIAIGAVLLISFLVLYLTANKILRRSPGDLIYDRV
ncbi:MAG: ABC transporter permease, partial [Bacteroidota bacterium]